MRFLVALFLVLNCSTCYANIDLVPDLDTVVGSIPATDPQTNNAVQSATKALCIQSGFKLQYDDLRNKANKDAEHDLNTTGQYIDDNTWFNHDHIFGAAAAAVMIAKRTASTSFADPFARFIQHYVTISPTEYKTGIRINF
jgi:hypothetical protein